MQFFLVYNSDSSDGVLRDMSLASRTHSTVLGLVICVLGLG